MANVKISALPAATTPLAGTEEVPIVQSSVTRRATAQDIADLGSGAVVSVNGDTGVVVLTASDVGAPALATANTFLDGPQTVNTTGVVVGVSVNGSVAGAPIYELRDNSAAANGKRWWLLASGALGITGVNDDGTQGQIAFQIDRAGAQITNIRLATDGQQRLIIGVTGDWQIDNGQGSAGQVLSSNGTGNPVTWEDAATAGANNIGYLNIPPNSQSANYVLVLSDLGKHILHPSGAGAGDTFTIPANASVSFPLGTAITFVNRDSNDLSIAITTDTMYLADSTTTGTRTLGENGMATAIKVETTVWVISGSGLT